MPTPTTTPPTTSTTATTRLAARLHRLRRGVLVLLGACALAIAVQGFAGDEPPPERAATTLALGLALGCVLLHRLAGSPVIRPATARGLTLAALALAASLGPLGLLLALQHGAPRSGLVYCLAGAIFALRPLPASAAARAGRPPAA